MQGDGDQQIERDLALIPADQSAGRPVDPPGRELGLQRDALLLEHAVEVRRGNRLGEGCIQRRRVGYPHLGAHSALTEVPVGEKAELQRRNRALDRQIDHVDDQAAAIERAQRVAKRHSVLDCVEGKDVLAPGRPPQTLGLIEQQRRSARDHKHVVGERRSITEVDEIRRPSRPSRPQPGGSRSRRAAGPGANGRCPPVFSRPKGTNRRPGW